MKTSTKVHKCEICDEAFDFPYKLKKHFAVHSDERSFECDICKSTFKRQSNLDQHMTVHAETALFECSVCGTAFGRKNSLRRHMMGVHELHGKKLETAIKKSIKKREAGEEEPESSSASDLAAPALKLDRERATRAKKRSHQIEDDQAVEEDNVVEPKKVKTEKVDNSSPKKLPKTSATQGVQKEVKTESMEEDQDVKTPALPGNKRQLSKSDAGTSRRAIKRARPDEDDEAVEDVKREKIVDTGRVKTEDGSNVAPKTTVKISALGNLVKKEPMQEDEDVKPPIISAPPRKKRLVQCPLKLRQVKTEQLDETVSNGIQVKDEYEPLDQVVPLSAMVPNFDEEIHQLSAHISRISQSHPEFQHALRKMLQENALALESGGLNNFQ